MWFGLRSFLGLFSAVCEAFLYDAVRCYAKKRWTGAAGSVMCHVFAVGMLSSAGMFAASTALLPNSFSMCVYMVAFAFWLKDSHGLAVACGAAGALMGVPFSVLLLGPMALHTLWTSGLKRVFPWAVMGAVVSMAPQIIIDRLLYRRWVVAVANIVYYNALSSETDSTLYGVEPWSFYAKNLVLNLNLCALLAPLALPLLALRKQWLMFFVCASSMVWLGFMLVLPHKEQRFLYPIYPLLILSGATVIALVFDVLNRWGAARLGSTMVALCLIGMVVVGSSRVVAQTHQRSGPTTVWHGLQNVANNATVCMGDDWYRFPSSFWLPHNGVKLRFIPSGFHGLLPKPFAAWPEATFLEPSGMNGGNQEVIDERFVKVEDCDFVVKELKEQEDDSKILRSAHLIDDSASRALYRAFYVPPQIRPSNAVVWKRYAVMRR